jgi:hypothetical protein
MSEVRENYVWRASDDGSREDEVEPRRTQWTKRVAVLGD